MTTPDVTPPVLTISNEPGLEPRATETAITLTLSLNEDGTVPAANEGWLHRTHKQRKLGKPQTLCFGPSLFT